MEREELLKNAKALYECHFTSDKLKHELEDAFPELKESEDERIRKALLTKFTNEKEKGAKYDVHGVSLDDIIAYLEKQPTNEEMLRTLRAEYEKGVADTIAKYEQKEQKPEEKPINWTELTWEDINELEDIINKVHYEFRNGIGQESFGKEVLERFREYKGDEYLDGIEQKPTEWSEDIIRKAVKEVGLTQHQINWFKTNVFPPKQEWSEEDENAITTAIRACRYMTENYENSTKQYEDAIERLKSLCPQPHTAPVETATKFGNLEYERGVKDGIQSVKNRLWKPSEEQIGALNYAYCELFKREDVGHNILSPLQKLIDTLIKL